MNTRAHKLSVFIATALTLFLSTFAHATPSLDDLDKRLSAVEAKLNVTTAATKPTTVPVIISAPVPETPAPVLVKLATPTGATLPIATARTTRNAGVEFNGTKAQTLTDVVFTDNTTGPAALMVRAPGSKMQRIAIGTTAEYAVFFDHGAINELLEDVTAAGVKSQSIIRTVSGTSGIMRRVIVPDTATGLAAFRGPGVWLLDNCYSGSSIFGPNALGLNDGGWGWILDRCVAPTNNGYALATNADETRRAVLAAAAKGVTDSFALAVVFRNTAKLQVPVDMGDPKKGLKAFVPSDDQLRLSIANRLADIGDRSNWTVTNGTVIKFGIELQAGTTLKFDGTNRVETTSTIFRGNFTDSYPPAEGYLPIDAAVKRPAPYVEFNGDTLVAPNGLGIDVKYVHGWATLNGKRVDFAKAA